MKARHHQAVRSPARLRPAGLALLVVAAGCSHRPPTVAPTSVTRGGGISLQKGWRATVLLQRDDSIILTLPSGDRQLQRYERHAGFTLTMDGDGEVGLRLDSLTFRPKPGGAPTVPLGATWSGRVTDPQVNSLHLTGGGDPAAELTGLVASLLPRLPAGGVRTRMTWADSGSGEVRVDIFRASEHRTAAWSTGTVGDRSGSQVLPILVREYFELLGDGQQGGRRLTMTSQGRRSGTYYLTTDGRLYGAQLDDSVAMLISIPGTRQVVPTLRFARTTVRFLSPSHDESDR